MDWDHLRIFLACTRNGSMRGAAEAVGVNHATIDRALKALEASLGARVFDRGANGLRLTQPGEILVSHAEEMERQSLMIVRKLTGLDSQPSGVVRVTVPPSLVNAVIAPMIRRFSDAFPEIEVRIIGTNRVMDLGKQEADVSIRVANEVADDVVGQRVLRYAVAPYASPEYIAAHPGLAEGDGSGAFWIGWSKEKGWITDSPFPKVAQRHLLPEVFMQAEAAANHLGMAYIPVFVGDHHPGIIRVPGTTPDPSYSIWVLFHDDLRNTARVRAFVDFVVAELRRNRKAFTQ